MSRETWLVYNDSKSIKIDRNRVARSCHYFEKLLEGGYKESGQHCIKMEFGDMFTFESFDCVVRYADEKRFLKDPDLHDVHIGAIQLAILWGYTEFIEIVESHLIEQINLDKLIDLMGLAIRHRPTLNNLYVACENFEKKLNNRLSQGRIWTRCSYEGHKEHHYLNCNQHKFVVPQEEDWDENWSLDEW